MDAASVGGPVAVAAVVVIAASIIRYVINSGLFKTPKVEDGTPPVRDLTIMYKVGYGDYKLSGRVFNEVQRLAPEEDTVGIYYDDPTETPVASLRWAVGVILAEGTEDVDAVLEGTLKSAGFRRHQLPCADRAVQAEWDVNSRLAMRLVYSRVYPALIKYMQTHSTLEESGPCVELYEGSSLTIMCPLDHQRGFFVSEIKPHNT